MSLTAKQHTLLTFIANRIRTTGVCPSIDEMMATLGSKNRGSTHEMVTILEERGYIRRLFPNRPRCIEVVRLPDDVSEHWLRAVSTDALQREVSRRAGLISLPRRAA